MTITLDLEPETQRRLEAIATQNGKDVSAYIHELIAKTLRDASVAQEPAKSVHAGMTFDEILAPAREGFAESGMTDEELSAFIEKEVKAYRAEKRAERHG